MWILTNYTLAIGGFKTESEALDYRDNFLTNPHTWQSMEMQTPFWAPREKGTR